MKMRKEHSSDWTNALVSADGCPDSSSDDKGVPFDEVLIWRYMAVIITIILAVLLIYTKGNSETSHSSTVKQLRRLGEDHWGGTFGAISSKYSENNCTFAGYKICCGALGDPEVGRIESDRMQNITSHAHVHGREDHMIPCTIEKEYIPSPYEMRHYNKSFEFGKIQNSYYRRDAYIEYMFSKEELEASRIWIERVRIHGYSDVDSEYTDVDYHYLSRFEVTKTCPHPSASSGVHEEHPHPQQHTATVSKWTEWIEPLSMHARHPFGFGGCDYMQRWGYYFNNIHRTYNIPFESQQSTDYIMFHSGASQYNHTVEYMGPRKGRPVKHFMLDAGTSTFESSFCGFVCAYLKRGISFDRLFGWEMTLLEPINFWSKVPPRFKSIYTFFNIPAQINVTDADSPLHVIRKSTTIDDFVSFKLDIDTPEVEIPMALQLAHDDSLSQLVDEFFFELHFRCEIMMYCGWDDKMPEVYHGLKLDRPHTLELFQIMRKKGIRAHFWP